MKTRNYFLWLLGLCVILTASRCKKNVGPSPDNPYGLPNATQTGAGIFACRINGENWISKTDIFHIGASLANNRLGLQGSSVSASSFTNIGILIKEPIMQGNIYKLGSVVDSLIYATTSTCLGVSFNVTTSNAINGSVTLTKLDKTNKVVSGSFGCTIPMSNCDTLKITDGRFDIKYD